MQLCAKKKTIIIWLYIQKCGARWRYRYRNRQKGSNNKCINSTEKQHENENEKLKKTYTEESCNGFGRAYKNTDFDEYLAKHCHKASWKLLLNQIKQEFCSKNTFEMIEDRLPVANNE